ncbi:MAG: flagellar hook-associated protein FlgK [Planctomycetota bacterium]
MPNFEIGLSALRTNQFGLQTISNNIANANTEGYHRRRAIQEPKFPNQLAGFRIGSGVQIARIDRLRDQVTEDSLTKVIADANNVEQTLIIQRQIESALLIGDNAVGKQIDELFAEFTSLSSSPNEPARRSALLESGQQLAGALSDVTGELDNLRRSIRLQIDQEIEHFNQFMQELSSVSVQISSYAVQGIEHNVELDKRDSLINQIAGVYGIARNENFNGDIHITIANHSIQQGNQANELSIRQNGEQIEIILDDSDSSLPIETGRLSALVDAYNRLIPEFESSLDQIATSVIHQVNQVHATGIGTAGSFQNLLGSQSIEDPNIPLAEALPNATFSAGDFSITLTDSNGDQTIETIAIDPSVDSLDDIATRLNALANVNASLRADTNELQIATVSGVQFDFTGGFNTQPDLAGVTGTSVATLSGQYIGEENGEYRIEIDGSGEIGVSANLFAEVFDSGGVLVNRINVGLGYEAGAALELAEGIEISFAAGTLITGDSFSTPAIANADETGILGALGLAGFFTGDSADTISVSQSLIDDPSRIASGKTGAPSDASNLTNFIDIANRANQPNNQTLSQFTSELGSSIGFEINTNLALNDTLTNVRLRLEQERDATSGVDLNEELVYLQEYQKAFEAAARVIQVTDEVLSELLSII